MSTSADSDKIKLRLHYWDCRGRAQAFRYMLEDIAYTHKNVDYKEDYEVCETISNTWGERRTDNTISGPFRSLPVLHWNDTHTFGQTLTIAHVLARKFNLYGKITATYNDPILLEGYINGIVTCAYTDVITNILQAIWATPDIEDMHSPGYFQIAMARDNLESLNKILKQSSTSFYYDQIEPTIADYFAFEAYLMARNMHRKLSPANCEALEKLEQIMKERPALANYFQNNRLFKRITAAPHEEEYLQKLSKIK
ncbi:unnamed protein product [Adineta steineri]|uniref:GST N-terminal domain-containing protein n=1 Tax=Adineta steineri TaxID=433720 RepID=A0A815HHQ9_9BILA|nr:unnamed protein product [Adineta steineri]CAF1354261.1 unnamed protein product [Adineta steineri]